MTRACLPLRVDWAGTSRPGWPHCALRHRRLGMTRRDGYSILSQEAERLLSVARPPDGISAAGVFPFLYGTR